MKKLLVGLLFIGLLCYASASFFYPDYFIYITGSGGGGGSYTGIHPIDINSDVNTISLASDFNQMYVSQFDLNLNVDGGFANSVYLPTQNVDGGGA